MPKVTELIGAGPEIHRELTDAESAPHRAECGFLGCYGVAGMGLATESRVTLLITNVNLSLPSVLVPVLTHIIFSGCQPCGLFTGDLGGAG